MGNAIRCRISAEVNADFTPAPGALNVFRVPAGFGVRVDADSSPAVIEPR
jgi:pyruvate carboxylase